MQHTTSHTTAVESPSHHQRYILIGKQWYQLLEFIPFNSNSVLYKEIQVNSIISVHPSATLSQTQDFKNFSTACPVLNVLVLCTAQWAWCSMLCGLSESEASEICLHRNNSLLLNNYYKSIFIITRLSGAWIEQGGCHVIVDGWSR